MSSLNHANYRAIASSTSRGCERIFAGFPQANDRIPHLNPASGGWCTAVDWILVGGPLRYGRPELHDNVAASDHYPPSVAVHIN